MRTLAILAILAGSICVPLEGSAHLNPVSARASLARTPLDFNALRFTNVAACGADSLTPTRGVFLFLDGFNAGKASHSAALASGLDANVLSQQGMRTFRLGITRLSYRVAEALLQGNLPLLSADLSEKNRDKRMPQGYATAALSCANGASCPELDRYIGRVWSEAFAPRSRGTMDWRQVDAFDLTRDFFKNPGKHTPRIGCYRLKRFSDLQANLHYTKPDREVLLRIANDDVDRGKNLGPCLETDPSENARYSIIQLELLDLQTKAWQARGFDFWNSLKLYVSWAWRNDPALSEDLGDFASLFRSIPLEDSIMIVPNGCRSVSEPRCDGDSLAYASIRDLAQTVTNADSSRILPHGADRRLMENPLPEVNTDILHTQTPREASLWLERFRQNLLSHRGTIKARYLQATFVYNALLKHLPASLIISEIDTLVRTNQPLTGAIGQHLYYLCGEFLTAAHPELSTLKKDLDLLAGLKDPAGEANRVSEYSSRDFYAYFQELSSGILSTCVKLEKRGAWKENFTLDKSGFYPWYKEIYQLEDRPTPAKLPYLAPVPLLTIRANADGSSSNADQVLCRDGVDCARQALDAVISLYSASLYAAPYLNPSATIPSPPLFNPYAERVACKTYDPWARKHQAVKQLLGDLANVGIAILTPIPVFAQLKVQPGHVTSIERLIEDGEIILEPHKTKSQIKMGLAADLGPLFGAPCTVVVSQSRDFMGPPLYAFLGVSFGGSVSRDTSQTSIGSGGSFLGNTHSGGRIAANCTLHFGSQSRYLGPVSRLASPARFAIGVIQAAVRLFKAKRDPIHYPHSFEVDINQVAQSYAEFKGNIPKKCVKRLRKAKSCTQYDLDNEVETLFDFDLADLF